MLGAARHLHRRRRALDRGDLEIGAKRGLRGEIRSTCTRSSPSRRNNACSRRRMRTYRSPDGPPRRPASPSPATRSCCPSSIPAGCRAEARGRGARGPRRGNACTGRRRSCPSRRNRGRSTRSRSARRPIAGPAAPRRGRCRCRRWRSRARLRAAALAAPAGLQARHANRACAALHRVDELDLDLHTQIGAAHRRAARAGGTRCRRRSRRDRRSQSRRGPGHSRTCRSAGVAQGSDRTSYASEICLKRSAPSAPLQCPDDAVSPACGTRCGSDPASRFAHARSW